MENYSFEEKVNKTTITVEVDISKEFSDYFDTTYPEALGKLKKIVEVD